MVVFYSVLLFSGGKNPPSGFRTSGGEAFGEGTSKVSRYFRVTSGVRRFYSALCCFRFSKISLELRVPFRRFRVTFGYFGFRRFSFGFMLLSFFEDFARTSRSLSEVSRYFRVLRISKIHSALCSFRFSRFRSNFAFPFGGFALLSGRGNPK